MGDGVARRDEPAPAAGRMHPPFAERALRVVAHEDVLGPPGVVGGLWVLRIDDAGLPAVLKYGVDRFRHEHVNSAGSDFTIGRWWSVAMILVVLEALVLLVWWFSQSLSAEGLAASVNPFRSFSLGTIVLQWAVLLAICLGLNRRLGRTRPIGPPEEAA